MRSAGDLCVCHVLKELWKKKLSVKNSVSWLGLLNDALLSYPFWVLRPCARLREGCVLSWVGRLGCSLQDLRAWRLVVVRKAGSSNA